MLYSTMRNIREGCRTQVHGDKEDVEDEERAEEAVYVGPQLWPEQNSHQENTIEKGGGEESRDLDKLRHDLGMTEVFFICWIYLLLPHKDKNSKNVCLRLPICG